MTPIEKAMDIAMKFDKDGQTDNALKCALICVEEILKARTVGNTGVILDKEYWQEVKKEISLL